MWKVCGFMFLSYSRTNNVGYCIVFLLSRLMCGMGLGNLKSCTDKIHSSCASLRTIETTCYNSCSTLPDVLYITDERTFAYIEDWYSCLWTYVIRQFTFALHTATRKWKPVYKKKICGWVSILLMLAGGEWRQVLHDRFSTCQLWSRTSASSDNLWFVDKWVEPKWMMHAWVNKDLWLRRFAQWWVHRFWCWPKLL